jgi:hypothetical protein
MTQLHRVLYCSRNLIPGAPEAVAAEIRSILAISRRNNARGGITGGLLFSEGCFAQVLEGPLDTVESAFERIQCDERHSDVTVLQSGPITTRDFPDWSMAFAGPGAASPPIAGMRMADAFAGQSNNGDKLLELLKDVIVRETEWLAPVSELATSSS